jgi:deazaflavin-dependent oxidoreductase (nitroreductase family)
MLQHGLSIGTQHVLTVVGRRTGKQRSTPVSLVTVDGARYIVAGLGDADWTRNVRAAHGAATLGRRGRQTHVRLSSVPVDGRSQILGEFLHQVRGGVRFLGLPAEPAALADAAPRCQIFRVELAEEERK